MNTDEAFDHLGDAVSLACMRLMDFETDAEWTDEDVNKACDEMIEAYAIVQRLKATKRQVIRGFFWKHFNRI